MSLEAAVAVPFRQEGGRRLAEGEFVVCLSLDLGWFTPDQATRLIDVASSRGLLSVADGDLIAEFDPSTVEVPDEFVPDESILRAQSTFEVILSSVLDAGVEKQTAVAEINERQRDLGVTLEAAAVLYALEAGVDVGEHAAAARRDLTGAE